MYPACTHMIFSTDTMLYLNIILRTRKITIVILVHDVRALACLGGIDVIKCGEVVFTAAVRFGIPLILLYKKLRASRISAPITADVSETLRAATVTS